MPLASSLVGDASGTVSSQEEQLREALLLSDNAPPEVGAPSEQAPRPSRSSINLFGRGRRNNRTVSQETLRDPAASETQSRTSNFSVRSWLYGGSGDGGEGENSVLTSIRRQAEVRGRFLALVTFVAVVVAVPVLLGFGIAERHHSKERQMFYLAGAFVVVTVPISIREIVMHLTHWYMPAVQKYVFRILWMVPLYSVQSWLSLRFHHMELYIDSVRDLYEAYVIQSFLYLLIEFLGGENNLIEKIRLKDPKYGRHSFPFRLLVDDWEMGEEFMFQCKWGVLQYVIIKVLATALIALCEWAGIYGLGSFSPLEGYVYISFCTNISQMWALYSLVMLYYAAKEDLQSPIDWKPVGKFLCVKGVIFFTWWQGFGIDILVHYGIIRSVGKWDADAVATGLQDFLVCVEMLAFAIAHTYTFTYREYLPGVDAHWAEEGEHRRVPFKQAFWDASLPKETFRDIERLRKGTHSAIADASERKMNIQLLDSEQI